MIVIKNFQNCNAHHIIFGSIDHENKTEYKRKKELTTNQKNQKLKTQKN